MRLHVTITAHSPLSLSDRKPAGQFQHGFGYIPGAVLRGSLAGSLIDQGLLESDLFQQLFPGPRPALFTNAYLLPGEQGFEETRPLPLTAASCKVHPGFLGEAKREADACWPGTEPHGAFDTLLDRLCIELLRPAALQAMLRCPRRDCGERIDRLDGFYSRSGQDFRQPEARQRLLTRVALNRRRRVAEDQLLYSPTVVSEAQDDQPARFASQVIVPDDLPDVLRDQLREAMRGLDRVGGGGSRGLGEVEVTVPDQTAIIPDPAADVKARVESFHRALEHRWGLFQRLTPRAQPDITPEQGHLLVLTLQSDAILRGPGWLPTLWPTDALRAMGIDWVPVRSFASYDYRGGWNAAWGLPKETEPVAVMGSTYVYWSQGEELDYHLLARLEEEGLGEGRSAGFGQVRICDGFHIIMQEDPR